MGQLVWTLSAERCKKGLLSGDAQSSENKSRKRDVRGNEASQRFVWVQRAFTSWLGCWYKCFPPPKAICAYVHGWLKCCVIPQKLFAHQEASCLNTEAEWDVFWKVKTHRNTSMGAIDQRNSFLLCNWWLRMFPSLMFVLSLCPWEEPVSSVTPWGSC